jgi:uncharacterized protein DUF6494
VQAALDRWHNGCGNFAVPNQGKWSMNEEALNLSIRKFLKVVGINSQREIEHAVAKALAAGSITGTESFPAKMRLEIAGLNVNVEFSGDIDLK